MSRGSVVFTLHLSLRLRLSHKLINYFQSYLRLDLELEEIRPRVMTFGTEIEIELRSGQGIKINLTQRQRQSQLLL